MNIYGIITIYTAKYCDNNDQKINEYHNKMREIMEKLGKNENTEKYQTAWDKDELWIADIDWMIKSNQKDYEDKFKEVLTNPKKYYTEEYRIITRKNISDNLDKNEFEIEKKNYLNQVKKELKSLDDISNLIYNIESKSTDVHSIFVNEEWAFEQLHTEEEQRKIRDEITQDYIKAKLFAQASQYIPDKLKLMKKVVKTWGTDIELLKLATNTIAKCLYSLNEKKHRNLPVAF